MYYRQSWRRIINYIPDKKIGSSLPFISIIVAARNEERNIGACLKSIIDQTYTQERYEIIVTDDHSTDATASIVKSFQKTNIVLLQLADFVEEKSLNSYKKKSIETALKVAKGDLIGTTDADCIVQRKWLETIADFYIEKQPVFVAMPVRYAIPENISFVKRFFYIFQALDFMTLQGITGASVSKGFHNMCNGANLAYEKKTFYEVNGFEGIDEIASGDDMLLMDKIQKAFPGKIGYLKSEDVIVTTNPAETISEFLNQRIRWASKADRYPDKKITTVLLLVYLLNAWLFTLAIASFLSMHALYWLITGIVLKIIFELFFLFPVAQFFKNEKLLWWFIPAQPFHIVYTIVAGWLGKFGSYKWKGRKVK